MLVIRFLRTGKKNQPSFKIVVVEKTRSSTSGRFVEEVGFYNPLTKEKVLKGERIKYWISVGAKPSETVHNLLVSGKIIEGKKIAVHKKSKEKKPASAEATAPAEPAPAEPSAETKPTETVKPEAKPVEEKPADEKPVEETSRKEAAE